MRAFSCPEAVLTSLAPIQSHLDALAVTVVYPAAAVDACLRQPEQAAPHLRALLQRAARGVALTDVEAEQLFLGIHILAKLRDTPTFLPLMRLLRRPSAEVEDLLGDAVTESLPKIVASVFDGDEASLFDIITDPSIDEFIRDAIWRAATFLTYSGVIARERMRDFIARFDDDQLSPVRDMGWVGWVDAIAALGFSDLTLRVARIWRDSRLPKDSIAKEEFEEDLAAALRAPLDANRLHLAGMGTIDDIAEALTWADWDGHDETPMPFVNPMRNVGRNDPCPCGSGKKAKKCCLASS